MRDILNRDGFEIVVECKIEVTLVVIEINPASVFQSENQVDEPANGQKHYGKDQKDIHDG